MFASCVASAYAVEPSERTFAATAALIGIATFAFTSDIASRSVSSRPISASSSVLLNCPVVLDASVILLSFVRLLVGLGGLFSKLVVSALSIGQLRALLLLHARSGSHRAGLVHVHGHGGVQAVLVDDLSDSHAAGIPSSLEPKTGCQATLTNRHLCLTGARIGHKCADGI